MPDQISASPLTWPTGWKRTWCQEHSRFSRKADTWRRRDITINEATEELLAELTRMGIPASRVIISTNLKLRNDGRAHSGQKEPEDRGVAVWWQEGKGHRVIALDKYNKVADNLYAVALTVGALRSIERWGSGEILQRTFTGFDALPHQTSSTWWTVLGVQAHTPTTEVEAAYKRARIHAHPDKPTGSDDAFKRVQDAWEAFCKERGLN